MTIEDPFIPTSSCFRASRKGKSFSHAICKRIAEISKCMIDDDFIANYPTNKKRTEYLEKRVTQIIMEEM